MTATTINLSNLSFSKIEVKKDMTKIYEMMDDFVKRYRGKTCAEIIDGMMNVFFSLPTKQDLDAFVKEVQTKYVFRQMFGYVIVDDKNKPIWKVPPEKIAEFDRMRQYLLFLKFHGLIARDLFNKLNGKGIPIFKCIIKKLRSDPFFVDQIDFIEIAVSEHEMKHFVASILIAGLRIEGIIRSVLNKMGIDTTRHLPDGTVEEKTLGAIFYGIPKTKQVLGEELYDYLRVLLIRKEGENLRNRLAHSLMELSDFDESLSALLFVVFLHINRKTSTIT